ncbi:MAG: T9SS type A sorting domain-containing protein [Bacteroidetes bacterium]|nr:T9SS type A sorting domain-containing protein [Bacteroidota bacterium]
MHILKHILLIAVVVLITPMFCAAQNFNVIYDFDSSSDWGTSIFYRNDGNYLVPGLGYKQFKGSHYAYVVSPDGKSIISKETFSIKGENYFNGYRGRVKRLTNGNYITPYSIIWDKPTYPNGYTISPGYGIMDSNGKMLFHKTFDSDTACCDQQITDCIVMPDKGYLLGGDFYDRTAKTQKGSLIKLDSNGNMQWRKLYAYYFPWTYYFTRINSMQLISNNRMVVGAHYEDLVWANPYINFNRPWFLLMDTAGNILRDSAYRYGFAGMGTMGGGNIFKDVNGGYFHYGQYDRVYNSQHLDFICNYPDYLAHLDDSFKMTWLTLFPDSPGHKYIWTVRQLHDSCYLVMAGKRKNENSQGLGWAAKVDKKGKVVWDNTYYFDTTFENAISDAVELPDHSIVFTGHSRDSNSPLWRNHDMWLLKIDSNGCEIPGCVPTKIKSISNESPDVVVYPNPVYEQLYIEGLSLNTRIQLFDLYGRVVYSSASINTKESINTSNLSPGNYILQLVNTNGERVIKKIVKE